MSNDATGSKLRALLAQRVMKPVASTPRRLICKGCVGRTFARTDIIYSIACLSAKRRMVAVNSVAAPEKLSEKRNLKQYIVREMSEADVKACISRPRVDFSSILQAVLHCTSMHRFY